MRKIITFLSTLAMIIMPFSASLFVPTAARAATTGLIKGPYDTVYWLSSNGKRYVFPTYNTFFSWYGYTSPAIQQLSLEDLGKITIGGNVTYKPGVRLVKVTTNPKVYAVSRYGILRWITNESLAAQLYGANWAQHVDDLPDPFFVNYNIGADINSTADFNPTQQSNSVTTPDDNIETPAVTNPTTPTQTGSRFSNTVSQTNPKVGDTVILTATLNSGVTSPAITKIEIVDPRTALAINTCYNQQSCTVAQTEAIIGGITNIIFHAKGYDASGNIVADEWFPTISISQSSTSNDFGASLTQDKNSITSGDMVTLTAKAWSTPATDLSGTRIEIWDDVRKAYVTTCNNTTSCVASLSVTKSDSSSFAQYAAYLKDSSGNILATGYGPLIAFTGVTAGTAGTLNVDKTSHASGQAVVLTFTPPASIPTANVYAVFYHEHMTGSVWSCSGQSSCTGSVSDWSNGFASARYYVMVYNRPAGTTGTYVTTIYSPTITYTTYDSCPSTLCTYQHETGPYAAASAPTITLPTPNQVYTNYPRLVDVNWVNDNQQSHTIEVACDYCGTGAMWSAVTTYYAGNYATGYQGILLSGDNQFRVRVKATAANGTVGAWSDWVYFRSTTNNSSVPNAPWITSPYQNQQYTNYPRTLTVQWFKDYAKKHTLEVACDYCASVTNMYSNPSYYVADNYATSYALPALAGDNRFRIRVKATNENGVDSAWSDYIYFTFKTPAVATTDLQITDVLFKESTVNDNLGALVGLKLNHQPYKVSLTFTNPTTGLKMMNGYSNITRSTVTPYEDGYVMLMNNLVSNIDYQYSVTAEDWDGKGSVTKTGIYHSPTLTQPYAYLDYQVVGTSQQGQIVISPSTASCDVSKCGYNFVTKSLAGYSGGAFYSGYYDNRYQIFANNIGQGGLALLANGDATPPLVSSGQYNRFGVPLTVGSWYAVYDEANQMFIKIHIAKLVTP